MEFCGACKYAIPERDSNPRPPGKIPKPLYYGGSMYFLNSTLELHHKNQYKFSRQKADNAL